MLHRLSGTVSLAKSDHQTHSQLSNITPSSCHTDSVCVCVCVCVHVCYDSVLGLCFVIDHVLQSGEIAHEIIKNTLLLLLLLLCTKTRQLESAFDTIFLLSQNFVLVMSVE